MDGQVAEPGSLDAHPSASRSVAPTTKPVEEPVEEPPADDLVDFGQNDGASAEPAKVKTEAPVTKDLPAKTPDEIEKMLVSTGKKADGGPLLDFGDEMKKTLPAEDKQPSDSLI